MIEFGTDGWRGVIADSFTFANLRKVVQAVADCLIEKDESDRGVIVGYDARFLSRQFAEDVALVLASNGIPVFLTTEITPTPVVSFAVKNKNMDGGIVVTASHNPPQYNGLKFKLSYGGPCSPSFIHQVEKQLSFQGDANFSKSLKSLKSLNLTQPNCASFIASINPKADYIQHILKLIDVEQVQKARFRKVVVDPMHGAARGYLMEILLHLGLNRLEVRGRPDPLFGGLNPEPILANLQPLSEAVVKYQADLGLATDGDGDRLGLIDEKGRFINAHEIFALLLYHLVENRGWRGSVVKTISTTQMIDELCCQYGLVLHQTPVGFKHICELMRQTDVLIGGEESGGLGIKGHLPERDGILSGLLLVELMAIEGKPISHILKALKEKAGAFYYARRDLLISMESRESLMEYLNCIEPVDIGNLKVVEVNRKDGIKFIFEDKSWLLLRFSGTEPLLRLYAEGKSQKQVQELLTEAEQIVNQ